MIMIYSLEILKKQFQGVGEVISMKGMPPNPSSHPVYALLCARTMPFQTCLPPNLEQLGMHIHVLQV